MCWIALIPKSKLYDTLKNQKTRWLDSIWIIDFQTNWLHTAYDTSTREIDQLIYYKQFINSVAKEWEELCFMHHRKASIWNITLDNAHPFVWDKFILAQNWTSKSFMDDYWLVYWKETDSETILAYLEEMCNTLEECIDILDEIDAPLWIIFLFHKGRTLIYSDSCRGSYISIYDVTDKDEKTGEEIITESYLAELTNLKEDSVLEYRNWFYLIVESTSWKILDEWNFDWEWYNKDIWNTQYTHWIESAKKTRKIKETKKNTSDSKYYNTHNNYMRSNNQSSIIINPSKKNTKLTKKQLKKLKRKSGSNSWNIMTMAHSYNISELESEWDVLLILRQYWINKVFNAQSLVILANLIYKLLKFETNYRYLYWIADQEVFNYIEGSEHTTDIHIDHLFLVPLPYLGLIRIIVDDFRNLNLIRHMRYLTSMAIDTHADYLLALQYFCTTLWDNHYYSAEYNEVHDHPLTLETYLFFEYKLNNVSDQEDVFLTHNLWPEMVSVVEWFIRAWHALWISAPELNVEDELYYNLTSRDTWKLA